MGRLGDVLTNYSNLAFEVLNYLGTNTKPLLFYRIILRGLSLIGIHYEESSIIGSVNPPNGNSYSVFYGIKEQVYSDTIIFNKGISAYGLY